MKMGMNIKQDVKNSLRELFPTNFNMIELY